MQSPWKSSDSGFGGRWDRRFASDMIGALVLVRINWCDARGEITDHDTFAGRLVKADPDTGFTLILRGARAGESYILPPALEAFRPADPGVYLMSDGSVIRDPEFVSSWDVMRPLQ